MVMNAAIKDDAAIVIIESTNVSKLIYKINCSWYWILFQITLITHQTWC